MGLLPSRSCIRFGLLFSLLLAASPLLGQTLVQTADNLPGTWSGNVAPADIDGDGDPDLLVTGLTGPADGGIPIAHLYRNTASGLQKTSDSLIGLSFGRGAFADYDGDGDLDLALSGLGASGGFAALYRNDGGSFVEDLTQSDLQAETLRYSALSWGDADNDGDADLVASGTTAAGNVRTVLFRNDRINRDRVGSPLGGQPLLVRDGPNSDRLVNLSQANLAWGDVDDDGDLDLAVTGYGTGGTRQAGMFLNEPSGILVRDTRNQDLTPVSGGDLAWGDIDNDGDLDLSLSGWSSTWEAAFQVFRNAAGILREDPSFSATRTVGALAFADVDNDGDLDLSASGQTATSDRVGAVLRNGPPGTLATDLALSFEGLRGGDLAWADLGGDGRLDLVVSGEDAGGTRRTRVYRSQTPVANTSPRPPDRLSTPFVTGDGLSLNWNDGADDQTPSPGLTYALRIGTAPGANNVYSAAMTPGPGNVGAAKTVSLSVPLARDTYYWAVRAVDGGGAASAESQEEVFRVQDLVSSRQNLRPLQNSALAWADYDNDGDLDLAIAGLDDDNVARSLLYRNDAGTLVENSAVQLQGIRDGSLAWADIDNDDDLDLILTGQDQSNNRYTHIYRNRLDRGDFALVLPGSFDLPQLGSSDLAVADYDNDGDLDLAVMGNVPGSRTTRIYRNQAGAFTEDTSQSLTGMDNGEMAWGDFDADGDLGLAIAGQVSDQNEAALQIYRNDDYGKLTLDTRSALTGVFAAGLDLGDADNDGDLDIAVCGFSASEGLITRLYVNDRNGLLANANAGLTGVAAGDVRWGDFDNDGDNDLALVGQAATGRVIEVYRNEGSAFNRVPVDVLVGVDFAEVTWADYDGDGDLDLTTSGRSSPSVTTFLPVSRVNDNLESRFNPNRAPLSPGNLVAATTGNRAALTWDAGQDPGGTPGPALTYALRLGTTPQGNEVRSGAAPLRNGRIRHNEYVFVGLPSGRYFWSVRAIDKGLRSSAWASESGFIIDTVSPVVDSVKVSPRVLLGGRRASVVVSFNDEPAGMDNAVLPRVTLQLSGIDEPLALAQVSYNGGLWIGEAEIEGEGPGGSAVVRVSGAADLKGNVMAPFEEVLPALLSPGAGGIVESADGLASLVVSPNALPALTQNPDVALLPSLGPAAPSGARLVAGPYQATVSPDFALVKPATLNFDVAGLPLDPARAAVYQAAGATWARIGGTYDAAGSRFRAPVDDFGIFALFEEAAGPTGTPGVTGIEFSNRAFSPARSASARPGGAPAAGPLLGTTDISFDLGAPATVRIEVHDRSGRLQRLLEPGRAMGAGRQVVSWDGSDHAGKQVRSGLYIVTITADGHTAHKTVAVVNR